MAKGLKTRGIQELEQFRKRVQRQYGLGRIQRADALNLERKVTELIGYVNDMAEDDPTEQVEVGSLEPEFGGDL